MVVLESVRRTYSNQSVIELNYCDKEMTLEQRLVSLERQSLPFGDWELATEKSEDAMGMEIDRWVAGNDARLVLSSERPGQESLALGQSSKKGRSVWFPCFTESKSWPRKDRGCLSIFESELTPFGPRSLSAPSWG